MRKHDEGYPRPERGSGEKGSQNKGLFRVATWVEQLFNRWASCSCATIRRLSMTLGCLDVPQEIFGQSSYGEASAGNNAYIVGISSIAQNQATESSRNFNSKLMIFLEKATQDFQVSYLWVTTYNQAHKSESLDLDCECIDNFSVEEDKSFHELDIEDLADKLPAFSTNEDALYDEERQQQLELQMKRLLTEPSDDGFSFLDKSILRKDLPIPEWYGNYDLTPEELEQAKIVRYIPGIGWFIDE
jgi:hypothetical protein